MRTRGSFIRSRRPTSLHVLRRVYSSKDRGSRPSTPPASPVFGGVNTIQLYQINPNLLHTSCMMFTPPKTGEAGHRYGTCTERIPHGPHTSTCLQVPYHGGSTNASVHMEAAPMQACAWRQHQRKSVNVEAAPMQACTSRQHQRILWASLVGECGACRTWNARKDVD